MRRCSKWCGDGSQRYIKRINENEVMHLRFARKWTLARVARHFGCSIATIDRRIGFRDRCPVMDVLTDRRICNAMDAGKVPRERK